MNKSLESLSLSLRLSDGGPPTHTTSFAFTRLWNRVVIEFLGRAPRTTPKQYQASGEEKIAHAVYVATERLFLSYTMRLAGEAGVDAKVGRHDLNDAQLRAVTRWLEMGKPCGSTFCAEMREQERRWRIVEWLREQADDIWEEVGGTLPDYVKTAAEWRGEAG